MYLSSVNIRKAHRSDRTCIAKIYNRVAGKVEGITRRPEEITETYIFSLLNKPENECIFLVVEDDDDNIIGFGHAERSSLIAYRHILSNYTIIVSPESQLKGVGRSIFIGFMDYITNERPDIKRLEMEVKFDAKRIELFEAMGFIKEAIIRSRARFIDDSFYDEVFMAWENPNFKA